MTYNLPPEIVQRIEWQLALGIYETPAAVLSDALDALEQRNADVEAIRQGIEDEKAGRLKSLRDFDQIRSEYGFAPHE